MKYRLEVNIEFEERWTWGSISGSMDVQKMCIDEQEVINFANNMISDVESDWPVPSGECTIKAVVKEENGCPVDLDYIYGSYKKQFIKN